MSFEALKAHLMAAPILRFPNFNKKYYIETNVSTIGLGAMFSQAHGCQSKLQDISGVC